LFRGRPVWQKGDSELSDKLDRFAFSLVLSALFVVNLILV